MLGLKPPVFEFRILCLEGRVISIISPSSGGFSWPDLACMCTNIHCWWSGVIVSSLEKEDCVDWYIGDIEKSSDEVLKVYRHKNNWGY